jgi:6-phosphogluconate dehydrogenase
LIEITAKVLARKDGAVLLVDLILDCACQRGTGKCIAQDSIDLMSAMPAFADVVHGRVAASKLIAKRRLPAAAFPSPLTSSRTHSTKQRSPAPLIQNASGGPSPDQFRQTEIGILSHFAMPIDHVTNWRIARFNR